MAISFGRRIMIGGIVGSLVGMVLMIPMHPELAALVDRQLPGVLSAADTRPVGTVYRLIIIPAGLVALLWCESGLPTWGDGEFSQLYILAYAVLAQWVVTGLVISSMTHRLMRRRIPEKLTIVTGAVLVFMC